jgi:predicted nucleotide-binding protein
MQRKVFMDIMLYFGRRGRENLRELKITDLALTTDADGLRYIYLKKDELTKNHQEEINTADGRMYEPLQ